MQGDELKTIRKSAGLTQGEMAAKLGLTSTFVGMMERGDRPVEPRTEASVRYLVDRLIVGRANDGRYYVARRTITERPSDTAMISMHGLTALYGVFRRRDHAYRWAAALRQTANPRPTRKREG